VNRRDFLATSALAALAGAIDRSSLARAWQQPQAPPPTPVFTSIRRNVGYFTYSGGTIGYLIQPKGGVVVDSQYRTSAPVFIKGWNERSQGAAVHRLINTHHHGDHTEGNIEFKALARQVVAHAKAAEHMRNPPGRPAPTTEQLYPDKTFTDTWREQVGDEWVRAKFYGAAHTSGDIVVTFERANIAHMGDLMFNRRHAIIDKAAGASIRNWIAILDKVPRDHANDTTYIFGHANTKIPVVGDRADLVKFSQYLTALLEFVGAQIKAGKSKDEIFAMRDPLKGFEEFGPFGNPQPNSAIYSAYEELTAR
jgi:glyoxylase-like metal-dependent hydrolase (beta-lactamase superfamily II)